MCVKQERDQQEGVHEGKQHDKTGTRCVHARVMCREAVHRVCVFTCPHCNSVTAEASDAAGGCAFRPRSIALKAAAPGPHHPRRALVPLPRPLPRQIVNFGRNYARQVRVWAILVLFSAFCYQSGLLPGETQGHVALAGGSGRGAETSCDSVR